MAAALATIVALAQACGDSGAPPELSSVDHGGSPDASDEPSSDGALASDAPAPAPDLDVLFLGNSYTYVNDLPGMLATIAQTGSPHIHTSSVTQGGARLADLWNGPDARAAVAKGGWTHVVLQEQSETPPCDSATFFQYAKLFAGAIQQAGAKTAFYETWARADGNADYTAYPCLGGTPTAMQDLLRDAYAKAAADDGGILVPVGEAWRAVRANDPAIVLFASDGSHPSPAGTYLTACVFYVTLTSQPVPPSASVPAGVDAQQAAVLRDAALHASGH